MNRSEVLEVLRSHRSEARARFGAREMGLFGSAARDELQMNSDVDVLVEFDRPATLDLYLGLQDYLSGLLGRPVDLVTRRGLKPRAWQTIQQDLIDVP